MLTMHQIQRIQFYGLTRNIHVHNPVSSSFRTGQTSFVTFLPSRPRLMPLPLLLDPPRPRLASLSPPFFSLISFISEGPPSFPRLRFFPTVSQEFWQRLMKERGWLWNTFILWLEFCMVHGILDLNSGTSIWHVNKSTVCIYMNIVYACVYRSIRCQRCSPAGNWWLCLHLRCSHAGLPCTHLESSQLPQSAVSVQNRNVQH